MPRTTLCLKERGSQGIIAVLACILLLGCASPTQAAPERKNNRYNVLFIAIDDLRPELGCYGVDYVDTPNIDKLASTGVTFLQHFVAVPTCGSSRYALLTGRSPLSSGVRGGQNNALYGGPTALKAEQQTGAQSMPELFNRSGYHTVLIGKISHTADGKVTAYNGKGDKRPELPHAWDDFATPYGPWKRGWGVFFAYADGKHREDGGGHKDLMEFVVEKDTDLPDGLMAERAIEKLKELKDKAAGGEPFFMGLGFYKPHLPFVAPKQDWDAVALWDVPEPAVRKGMETQYANKKSNEFYKYTMDFKKTRPLALKDAQAARRAYLACVRYTDRQIGKVLDALEEQGLADSTIVVLWGDHGYFLGEANQWGKHSPLETALHSPLIIRAPGIKRRHTGRTSGVVSTIDIYPTLIDLCKPKFTDTHHKLDGKSLVELMTGEAEDVHFKVVSTWGDAISYRTYDMRVIYREKKDKRDVEAYDMSLENGAFIDRVIKDPQKIEEANSLID
ncbi:MAG: sulfatase [Phycisphaeraceae bacterium]|nr:sulfatase [Phycisphaeraceae bacterium]